MKQRTNQKNHLQMLLWSVASSPTRSRSVLDDKLGSCTLIILRSFHICLARYDCWPLLFKINQDCIFNKVSFPFLFSLLLSFNQLYLKRIKMPEYRVTFLFFRPGPLNLPEFSNTVAFLSDYGSWGLLFVFALSS